MRRLAIALALLAAVGVALSAGTRSAFTETAGNPAEIRSSANWAPVNTAPPGASGTVALLSTLTSSAGTWGNTNVTPTIARRWQYCPGGTSCVDIPGEIAPTYTITALSLQPILGVIASLPAGAQFRVVETATNTWGSTSAGSVTIG